MSGNWIFSRHRIFFLNCSLEEMSFNVYLLFTFVVCKTHSDENQVQALFLKVKAVSQKKDASFPGCFNINFQLSRRCLLCGMFSACVNVFNIT